MSKNTIPPDMIPPRYSTASLLNIVRRVRPFDTTWKLYRSSNSIQIVWAIEYYNNEEVNNRVKKKLEEEFSVFSCKITNSGIILTPNSLKEALYPENGDFIALDGRQVSLYKKGSFQTWYDLISIDEIEKYDLLKELEKFNEKIKALKQLEEVFKDLTSTIKEKSYELYEKGEAILLKRGIYEAWKLRDIGYAIDDLGLQECMGDEVLTENLKETIKTFEDFYHDLKYSKDPKFHEIITKQAE